MRLAHVLVCHSVEPTKLFDSIPHQQDDLWYVFLHSGNKEVAATVSALVAQRDGNLFPYEVNRGLAKSWNDGLHLALESGCEAVLLLNDDLFFYENAYLEFRKTIETALDGPEEVSFISVNGLESGTSPYSGQIMSQGFACCALTKAAIERIGYFDQNFWPAYFEDVDYARRAALAGLTPHTDTRALVEHERSSTTRLLLPAEQAALAVDFQRNKSYFERKWGGSMDQSTFMIPFCNPNYTLKIAFRSREVPYEGIHELNMSDLATNHSINGVHRVSSEELAQIATIHQTDKWNGHWYAGPYATHLEYLRGQKFDLLEIGVGGYDDPKAGGNSLRAWKEYFPHANIIGLDLYDKKAHQEERISIYQGSQSSPIAIASILKDFPEGLDVIIDDGSHRSEHVLASFTMLWQFVKTGGWYIIEDLQTSYWPNHGGKLFDVNSMNTTMGFLKSLVDSLNWQEMHQPTYEPNYVDTTITGIHFYHNIVFIKKGDNREGSTEVPLNRINHI